MTQATVLIVDDEQPVINSLRRVLRKENYQLLSTTDPLEAIEILKKNDIDVLLSDQRMPKMTGVELLVKAREISPDTIRIMLTAYTEWDNAENAINKGEVWRFFTKPWNDDIVRDTIREGVNLSRMKKENKRLLAIIHQQNQMLKERSENLEKKVEAQEKVLKDAQASMLRTEKLASLGMIAGGIAHEINNPLGGILTMTELLLSEVEKDSPIYADLKEIEAAALHSKSVVENLLKFARQSKESIMKPVFLSSVLEQVRKLLGHSLEIKDVELVYLLESDLPPVFGDSSKLQQVFMNLFTNAAQAMPDGGRLTVSALKSDDNGKIIVDVTDTGIGIPPEIIPRIFDPFFTTKAEGEGTGLGLSVSYGIIKEHNGEIEVKSVVGRGTTFTISLPIALGMKDSAESASISLQEQIEESREGEEA